MPKKEEGFLEGLIKDMTFQAAIEASRGKNGKPDPYKAAGIVAGLGHTSFDDTMRLGAMLGAQGAFKDDDEYQGDIFDRHPEISDPDWRDLADDGSDVGLDPDDFETEVDYQEALDNIRSSWRLFCEDGSDYGIYPEDYETEEEYNAALSESQNAWRDHVEDGTEYGLDKDDFETEEEYEAALEDAKSSHLTESSGALYSEEVSNYVTTSEDEEETIREEDFPNRRRYEAVVAMNNPYVIYCDKETEKAEKDRCAFIIERGDSLIAANYLTVEGDFLYSLAIKDHFSLPFRELTEEEAMKIPLDVMLEKIQLEDPLMAIHAWAWCIDTFLPHSVYSPGSKAVMTNEMFDSVETFSEDFTTEFIRYLGDHPEFRKNVVRESERFPSYLADLIIIAVQKNSVDTGKELFKDGLFLTEGSQQSLIQFVDSVISYARNYDELETAECVQLEFLPLLSEINDKKVQRKIQSWETDIAKYIKDVESECEKYAYSRGNAWRKTVPDGKKYGLSPLDYDSEQEYLDALADEQSCE